MAGLRHRRTALARADLARLPRRRRAMRRCRFSRFARRKSRCCRRASAASRSPASWATRSGCRPTASSCCTTRCCAAGEDLGLTPFGARALHSLRLEKSFGTWAREYRPIYTPAEAGLDRFVDGRQGRVHRPRRGAARSGAATEAPPGDVRRRRRRCRCDRRRARVARRQGRRLDHVGRVWALRQQVDRARLRAQPCSRQHRNRFEVEILGERRRARLAQQPLYDPAGERMRLG